MDDLKKKLNDAIKKSQQDSKLSYCLCCQKETTSFCNSHSIPKFILKNISANGYVITSNNYFKMPLIKNEKGLNSSGTFKRICNDCDNKLFKNYESPEQLLIQPRKKIMAQIDLKNCLKIYDKRLNEISLYNNLQSINHDDFYANIILETQKVNFLDLNEVKNELIRDMKILNKLSTSSFELIFWEKLDYVVPLAFQGHIALVGDLKGNTINDIYNKNKNYIIENINICIFPLSNQSVIMMFINKDNKKYKEFIKQFKKLNKERKLQLISYIVFNYSEDFFIASKAKEELLNNKLLDVVTQNTTDIYAINEEMLKQFKNSKFKELLNYTIFPNLLDKKYAIIEKD